MNCSSIISNKAEPESSTVIKSKFLFNYIKFETVNLGRIYRTYLKTNDTDAIASTMLLFCCSACCYTLVYRRFHICSCELQHVHLSIRDGGGGYCTDARLISWPLSKSLWLTASSAISSLRSIGSAE